MESKSEDKPAPQKRVSKDLADGEIFKPGDTLADDEELTIALANYVPDTVQERRLANANAAGMSESLNMKDNDYSLLVYLFFVGYFLCEVPSNMIMNKCRPSIYLPTIVWVWGCIVIALSQAKNYKGFLAGRFFLGCIEAGLFPGAIYLLTCWYTKKEIGKRFCIFYTSGCIAPALGGIMAGAIVKGLEGVRGIPGWRWLFIVEGALTVFCGFGLYFLLPDYPRNARYFSPDQRRLAQIRILVDQQVSVGSTTRRMTSWQAFKAVVTDGKTWFFLIAYSIIILGMSISYFVPTILKTMGYTKVTAQWMTVPIWITGASDQMRSTAIAFVNSFGHLAIIYGSYLWPSTNAPQHLVGFATLTATCGFGCVVAIVAPWYFKLLPKEPVNKAERELGALQQQDQQRQES
ncbi:hypothetical protein FOC1_g10004434 [Fusarium oxysporum f. sp. cubense race 1]|uniref:Major facilitator superfamily (MFS) profile domain-containing protein n=1 Tax=Fusarium oxysporum f. sp. cubense (strain race 1) TaxID=1229664 RepID=N4TKX3_FUSC1|nr:hypothetical protein FOC1_g10004434 [Fusarium oxysporum f. sp. cubense race 1]